MSKLASKPPISALLLIILGGLLSSGSALGEPGDTPASGAEEAKPAPEPPNAIRPGRTGRDFGSRRTGPVAEPPATPADSATPAPAPAPTATLPELTPPPPAPVQPIPIPEPVTPTLPPTQVPEALPAPTTQIDVIRQENERRRLRMEEIQRQAEEAERKRKEIRHRQLLEEQQEGIRRSEEARRKLWDESPR